MRCIVTILQDNVGSPIRHNDVVSDAVDKSGTADKRSQIPLRTRIHVHSRSPVAIVGASKKVDTQSERRAGAKLTRLSALDSFISDVWKISAAFRRDTRKDQLFADRQLVMGCHLLRTDQQGSACQATLAAIHHLSHGRRGVSATKNRLRPAPRISIRSKIARTGTFSSPCLPTTYRRTSCSPCAQRGDTRGWQTLRSVLQPHSYGTLIAPTVDDTVH